MSQPFSDAHLSVVPCIACIVDTNEASVRSKFRVGISHTFSNAIHGNSHRHAYIHPHSTRFRCANAVSNYDADTISNNDDDAISNNDADSPANKDADAVSNTGAHAVPFSKPVRGWQ